MKQALLVEVRFYEGRYHGAGDWPPAPARLFQSLMAGAARGAAVSGAARKAFDWLERQPPPVVAAPSGRPGQNYTAFVPNNDLDAMLETAKGSTLEKAVAAVRVGKHIRPILFDATTPLLYCWVVDAAGEETAALCEIAKRLHRLGWGVDMAWAEAAVVDAKEAEERIARHAGIVYRPSRVAATVRDMLCPRHGSTRSLTSRFEGMRARFQRGSSNRAPKTVFVQPRKPLFEKVAYSAPPRRAVFELRMADAPGDFSARRLRDAASLVAEVRDHCGEKLTSAAPELTKDVNRYLFGRDAGERDKEARVRIVAIPSVGHPDVDMNIRRIAVYAPQACPLPFDDLVWAFAQVACIDGDGVIASELQRADDAGMVGRFESSGRRWRSVTPLALSAARRRRARQAEGARERAACEAHAAAAARQALRHEGVRAPAVEVRVQQEPFDRKGARAEAFAPNTRFSRDILWHAAIEFAEPVKGPLLLGDGRYLGLGLMRPDDPAPGIVAFAIGDGLENSDALAVAHAARRAMMARVQKILPPREKIPLYASGHEEDGAPAADGAHRHIAVVADLPRRRILYVAPHRLRRGGVRWRDISKDHDLVARALEGMDILRAGKAGKLALAAATVDPETDPLFAPARVWESVTEYAVTRHRRRLDDGDALAADVAAELQRCGWPLPAPGGIQAIAVRRGSRGGLAGRLRLTFPTAQPGPLAIGRTAHKGGGWFRGR